MLPMALKGFRIKASPNKKDIGESQWDTANEAKRKQIFKKENGRREQRMTPSIG